MRRTDYETFEASSVENRRLLREEELILETTTELCEVMERGGVNRAELAGRLGKTRGYVTQLLSGGRNLTLRTLASVADALEHRVSIELIPNLVRPHESHWYSLSGRIMYAPLRFTLPENLQIEIPSTPTTPPGGGIAAENDLAMAS